MMKTLPKTSLTELPAITNINDLQIEARRISESLKMQEMEIRSHLKRLPREAMKVGVGNVVPSIINSKVAGIALTAGTALLGNYLLPKAAISSASLLGGTLKKAGLATLGQMAMKWILKKKKK
ncbi:hypothetical protein [Flavihumibacter fluvii]|uniref:hypothetical protein n=1 Tax=Flavihumibacter fluvii TaxID=2838157 RepID=UPI001EFA8376|nr:hypothetical protein [Flavihumibacter fluvii]ULQ52617.1 hypothetical protein KJS93_21245 [Flavihumibacter fluvii]